MNNIITKNIGTLEFIELRDQMNMCIRNSIFACDDDGEKISVFRIAQWMSISVNIKTSMMIMMLRWG